MQLIEVTHQHHAVEHGDAQQGNETHRGRHGQVLARQPQPHDAAHQREGNIAQHQQGLAHRAKGGEQDHEDEAQRQRHHQCQARGRALLVLELPTPGNAVAGG